MNMLPFELTAIDIILALAVLILFVLYWTKLSQLPDERFLLGLMTKNSNPEKFKSKLQNDDTECPRGFGNIKKICDDGSVSELCLNCYKIMDCYSGIEEVRSQLSQF